MGTGIHAGSIQLDWAIISSSTPNAGSFHPGIFLIGFQVEAHEHIIMRHRLHVFHVIGESRERAEPKETEHFHGAFLFADEFGFDLFQTALAGDVDEIRDQGLGQAVGAKLRMNINADPGDVPFPSAELLVERGASNDFTALQAEERKVSSEINGMAPFVDQARISDAMFDEHQLGSRHGEKEFVERFFVVGSERPHLAFPAAGHFFFAWIIIESGFERHRF